MESSRTLLLCIILFLGLALGHEGFERTVEGPQRRTLCSLTCQLTPDQETGPFYSNLTLYRQNITEDRVGVFAIYIYKIIDISTCDPLANAAVDMWQCDAVGIYSAFTESDNEAPVGSTYLRGIQLTNATGIATFYAIYPGYYSGLDTHTHVKVRLNGDQYNSTSYVGGRTVHIGRVFYNDSISDIMQTASPYSTNAHGTRTTLENDRVYLTQNGSDSMATVVPIDGSNYLNGVYVYITLGVDTSLDASASSEEVSGNAGGSTSGGGASGPPSSGNMTGLPSTTQGASTTQISQTTTLSTTQGSSTSTQTPTQSATNSTTDASVESAASYSASIVLILLACIFISL